MVRGLTYKDLKGVEGSKRGLTSREKRGLWEGRGCAEERNRE